MFRTLWLALPAAFGLATAPASANPDASAVEAQKEARIPFINHGGIRDWRVGDQDTIYIQDRHRRWYETKLMTPVVGLRSAWTIGFETRGTSAFDRFSNVIIDGGRYPVQSLVRIDGPPPRHGRSAPV